HPVPFPLPASIEEIGKSPSDKDEVCLVPLRHVHMEKSSYIFFSFGLSRPGQRQVWRSHFNKSVLDLLIEFGRSIRKFALDVLNEFLHLALHVFQPLPHVENDFNAGKVYAKISREVQYQFEPFEIFLSV